MNLACVQLFADAAWRVVHEDAALLVLDKPAGLLAVPGRGEDKQDCLWHHARARWPELLVVHRLDQATSGLIVFARGAAVQRSLSMAFERRAVHKRYEAVVRGVIEDDAGTVELPIGADWPNRPRQRVDHAHGKPSLTRWHVLARDAARQRTRLALQPLTGRSHQLRVHLLAIGHPIVGDRLYAEGDAAVLAGGPAEPRLLLHATRLAFDHPLSGSPFVADSAAPF